MRVLLVEDEQDLARALLALLAHERYQAEWAASVEQAYAKLAEAEPDLLVLDVMLPEGEDAGFKLAQDLRHSGYPKPILFLTARDTLEDRVHGLDLGGDDYLTKPFEVPEFMARVRALLRREGQTKQSALERGPLRLDFAARRVIWGGQEAVLTEKEFALLEVLAHSPERVFTVNELLDRVFPEASSGHHALRMYVSRVREKLAPEAIVTVPGGYRLGLS